MCIRHNIISKQKSRYINTFIILGLAAFFFHNRMTFIEITKKIKHFTFYIILVFI